MIDHEETKGQTGVKIRKTRNELRAVRFDMSFGEVLPVRVTGKVFCVSGPDVPLLPACD